MTVRPSANETQRIAGVGRRQVPVGRVRLMEGPTDGEVATASRPSVPWGLGHVGIGWLIGMVATVIAMAVAVAAVGSEAVEDPSLTVGALLQGSLYVGLVGMPVWLVLTRGVQWAELGWVGPRSIGRRRKAYLREAGQGLLIGVVAQLAVVPAIYAPILLLTDNLDVSGPARELVDRADGLGIALLILMVVVLAPVAEEMFFRGLALRALEARMAPRAALIASAAFFGVTHFQLLQLPALVMIGLVCGWLAQRDGRLSRALWAHVGFNATTTVVLLAL